MTLFRGKERHKHARGLPSFSYHFSAIKAKCPLFFFHSLTLTFLRRFISIKIIKDESKIRKKKKKKRRKKKEINREKFKPNGGNKQIQFFLFVKQKKRKLLRNLNKM